MEVIYYIKLQQSLQLVDVFRTTTKLFIKQTTLQKAIAKTSFVTRSKYKIAKHSKKFSEWELKAVSL